MPPQATSHKRGGTKPKNVKLRPAPAPAPVVPSTTTSGHSKTKATKKEAAKQRAKEDEDEEDEAFKNEMRRNQLPLKGCVICLSGIKDTIGTEQARYGKGMGAVVDKSLTMDATHLVCNRPGSAKYHAAIANGIAVMSPEWLEALYSSWSEGGTVDLADAAHRYRLPSLRGVHACLTGSSASAPRQAILSLLSDNGAEYSGVLSPTTTHLVVVSDDEVPSEELLQDAKIRGVTSGGAVGAAAEVVWLEWIEDSVQVGGTLPVDKYRVKAETTRPGRLHLPTALPSASAKEANRRDEEALLQANQKDRLERAVVKKRAMLKRTASMALEEDLSFAQLDDRHGHPSKRAAAAAGDTIDEEEEGEDELEVAIAQRQGKDAAAAATAAAEGHARLAALMDRTRQKEGASVVKRLSAVRVDRFTAPALPPAPTVPARANARIWQGLRFSLCGMNDKKRAVPRAISQCGGEVVMDHAAADYTVVPLINPPEVPVGCNPVTIVWLERCCFAGENLCPDAEWGDRPVRANLPISNANQLKVTHAGFEGPSLKTLGRLCKGFGLELIELATKTSITHCLSGPRQDSSRLQTVRRWITEGAGIEVVGMDWLIELTQSETIVPDSERMAIKQQRGGEVPAAEADVTAADTTGDVTTDIEGLGMSMVEPDTGAVSAQKASTSLAGKRTRRSPRKSIDVDSTDLSREDGPLAGCVVYLSKKVIGPTRGTAIECCRRLGGEITAQLTAAVSHVVHMGEKTHDSKCKELQQARHLKAFVVHPRWLDECRATKTRVDEYAFPHTYRPGVALSYAIIPDRSTQMRRSVSNGSMKLVADEDGMPPPLRLSSLGRPSPAERRSPVQRRQAASLPSSPFANQHLPLEAEDSGVDGGFGVSMDMSDSFLQNPSPFKDSGPSSEADVVPQRPGAQTQMNALLDVLKAGMSPGPVSPPKKSSKMRPSRRVLGEGVVGVSGTRSLSDLSASELGVGAASSHRRIATRLEGFGLDDGADADEVEESMRIEWNDPRNAIEKERILRSLNGTTSTPQSTKKRTTEVDLLLAGSGVESEDPPLKRSRTSKR